MQLFSLHLAGTSSVLLPRLVHEFEQSVLGWAMRGAGDRQTKADEILGMPRTTLQSKLMNLKTLVPRAPAQG